MKRHRTSAPPPGALTELRNPRLYGGRDEQIAGLALRSRSITGRPAPDPDRPRDVSATVAPRVRGPRTEPADTPRAHARRVGKAYAAMVEAQAVVTDARMRGDESARLAAAEIARELRSAYLAMTGEAPMARALELASASDACRIKAAA
jgi:hypothetical protein